MSTVNVTSSEFEGVILKGGITFVDFWAGWCGPCKAFAPVFENASTRYPEINFVKVDTDAESELAAAANITSIPTLMAFRDGILVFREPGALSSSTLEELIQSVKNLDMESIKAEITAEAAKQNEK
jgi:thioredoxin 1